MTIGEAIREVRVLSNPYQLNEEVWQYFDEKYEDNERYVIEGLGKAFDVIDANRTELVNADLSGIYNQAKSHTVESIEEELHSVLTSLGFLGREITWQDEEIKKFADSYRYGALSRLIDRLKNPVKKSLGLTRRQAALICIYNNEKVTDENAVELMAKYSSAKVVSEFQESYIKYKTGASRLSYRWRRAGSLMRDIVKVLPHLKDSKIAEDEIHILEQYKKEK